MITSDKTKRIAAITMLCGLAYLLTAILCYFFFLDRILVLLYGGKLYASLSHYSRHREALTFSSYLVAGHLLFSRLSLLIVIADLFAAAFIARRTVRQLVVTFFNTPTSPVNLAIFRIAVFGITLVILNSDAAATIWFSSFPHQLQVAPLGVGWLLPYVPISTPLVTGAFWMMVVVCVFGLFGVFSRASSAIAVVLGLYVLGITQIYGKVSHDHELLWFMAILAASPCGDALSVDALFASRKRADREITEPPADSVCYSLPLRFASLLLGIIYFFPGFWKFWNAGFDWALSDNLKYQMYSKWMEFDGWTPFFRLDHYPWLYRGMAFGTLCFEMSFVFLIFFPRLRRLAAIGGIMFHVGSYFFLRIFFYDLVVFYVVLFDVSGSLKTAARWVFKRQLTVFYDEDCGVCRRAIAAIRTVDLLGGITYMGARQDAAKYLQLAPGGDPSQLLIDIHAVKGQRQYQGVETYRAMAIRIPFLWPLLPFLVVPPFERMADKVYQRVNHSRSCSLPTNKNSSSSDLQKNIGPKLRLITVVGILLLAVNVYTGLRRVTAGWPFACYPTFAFIADDEVPVLEIEAVTRDGKVIPTDTDTLRQSFADQRLRGLLELTLQNPGDSFERLKGVWQLYIQKDPRLKNASTVRFYRNTVCTIPEKKAVNPVRRELIVELNN